MFLQNFCPGKSTLETAALVGKLSSNNFQIETLQKLTPKYKNSHNENFYHGNFGCEEYPAHTDLAHWSNPPRYLMLRAKKGTFEVQNHIYCKNGSLKLLPEKILKSAVFVSRKNKSYVIPLAMQFARSLPYSIRWDSIFLMPANKPAFDCAEIIKSSDFKNLRAGFKLSDEFDTLLIDNWQNLHGRSCVPKKSIDRIIERVYLDLIYES